MARWTPSHLGSKTLGTATYTEPQCKPNYLSSMSYLYPIVGLYDALDKRRVDYSGTDMEQSMRRRH